MKVLVTGGTGVIGESAVRALHAAGFEIRVLSRSAGRGETWWPSGVEGWAGDVSNEKSIEGAGEGCEVVVHIAGIVDEHPPVATFQSVNIDGTRYVVLEAERAGVRRIVYVSSLGAERGRSAYHKSKFVGEDVVRAFSREWVVLRPGAIYGPGDEHISILLRMVRTLPIVPTIGDGNQLFQPIWHEDFAAAVMESVRRDDVKCRVLEIAGIDHTSQNDLVSRFRAITGRQAMQAPVPEAVAQWGLRALDTLGVDIPFNEAQMEMLTEGNVIPSGCPNALVDAFGIDAVRLDDGLRRLADEQPEQLPSEGVGALTRKRFWVDVRGGRLDADGLFEHVRRNLAELLPPIIRIRSGAEKNAPLQEGQTLTLELPMRGHVQVRVAEVADRRVTLLTVAGHPVAGAARFLVEARDDALRFEIQVYDRAANLFDQVLMRTVGDWFQRGSWIGFAENVARAAGGTSSGVKSLEEELDANELKLVNEWAEALATQTSPKSAPGAPT